MPPQRDPSAVGRPAIATRSGGSARDRAAPRVRRAPSTVEVRAVRSRRDLVRFVKLPWSLYRDQPQWVAQPLADHLLHLDRIRNPFFQHAEAEYFLACRDGEPVGRISAHVDRRFNLFQENAWGLFGFFECEDDTGTADALLSRARAWLLERGRDRIVGPMDFNTNHACGLLVGGHERPPQVLENWHHPYYRELLEGHGLKPEVDLLKWRVDLLRTDRVPVEVYKFAARLEPEFDIRLRNVSPRELGLSGVGRGFMEVYNSAWERNWGFVPLTEAELTYCADQLRPMAEKRWTLVAETGGEVVGAALAVRDYNQARRRTRQGRPKRSGPRGLRPRRSLKELRVLALNIMPEYRHTGVNAAFYGYFAELALANRMSALEMGWVPDSNEGVNRAIEAVGAEVTKRYRIYAGEL